MKRLMVVKVGSDERPASEEDIINVRDNITKAINEGGIFVSHHAIEIDLLPIDDVIGFNVKNKSKKNK